MNHLKATSNGTEFSLHLILPDFFNVSINFNPGVESSRRLEHGVTGGLSAERRSRVEY
jgi:hypothetical protein